MGKIYSCLTWVQRLQIEQCLKAKVPVKEIAERIGVHLSTVYREIKRGTYMHLDGTTWKYVKRYSPDIAHQKYLDGLSAKGAPLKLNKDFEFATYVEKRIIEDRLSPGAVLGEIKHLGLNFNTSICTSTLYSYIEKGVFFNLSLEHLPNFKKKKHKKRKLVAKRAPKGTSIEKRPSVIGERKTFGHWEMDCVCGPTKATLLVLTERFTRKEIIFLMKNQKAESVVNCLNRLERLYGKSFKDIFKSITVDNGSEFADFEHMEKSSYGKSKRINVYYCHPYCSCERGTNERINREIRRRVPKGTDLSKLTERDVQKVEEWVNQYPRRIFNYASSQELFDRQIELLHSSG